MSDKGNVKPSPCRVTDTAQMLGILLHLGQTAQLFEFLHRVACLVLELPQGHVEWEHVHRRTPRAGQRDTKEDWKQRGMQA